MAIEYTQKQLEVMVEGRPVDPTVTFYEQAVLDVENSNKEGHRVYRNQVMIKRIVPGVTDYVAQRASAQDIKRWPEEYEAFNTEVHKMKSPGLEVLPGISNVEKQELIDRGLSTVARLADSLNVPEHLAHLQPVARRIHQAIQAEEIQHGNEEEGKQEESREETADVSTAPRRDDRADVGQPDIPHVRSNVVTERPEGNKTSGRYNGGGRQIDDWKVDFNWSK
jgi:hypothetical protein